MIEFFKKLKRVIEGKDFYINTTIQLAAQKIGNNSEGWWISAENLTLPPLVFSLGLGEDVSFDVGMMHEYDAIVYGIDPTPKSIHYVKSLNLPQRFTLLDYAISDVDGLVEFNLPIDNNSISGSITSIHSDHKIIVKSRKFATVLDELSLDGNKIDILKMDVEGAEYKIVNDIFRAGIFPRQILIEFHHFFDSFSKKDTVESIELLSKFGYKLFYIEGYNYSFIKV